jgi:hypothetical protein
LLRPRPWLSVPLIAMSVAGSVAVARSYAAHGAAPAHSTRWQGPFEYVREFASSAPGCSYRGRETVHATVTCTGSDLRHLQCNANGTASHAYHEELQQDGKIAARNDAGEYQGALKASYDTHVTKDVDLFRLDVGANLPVQYRRSDGGTAKTGEYLLDVAGSTRDLVFTPQNERLERRRVEPIYEPGPAACGVQGRFNGTETVAMRLLPAE